MSDKKRLLTNFVSLASVQGVNFVLPLVTLAYLTAVLGFSKFGVISWAQWIIQYFILFTDYGFIFVATRQVSLAREDKKELSVIFSSVMAVRLLLLLFSFIVLMGLVLFVPKFQLDPMVYLLTFGMVIGNVMFPIWFFQGMEDMKVISILNSICKIVFTVFIFIFVKNKSQFLYVPAFNSLAAIAIGVIALYMIFFQYKIKFVRPSLENIRYQFKEGWHIFVSNIVTSLYTTSNGIVLGFFVSNTVVGYYSSAEKVIKAAVSVITPVVQTIYPYLSRALEESREKAMIVLNRVFILVTVIMGVISIIVAFNTDLVVHIFVKDNPDAVVPLLKILSPFPLILGWANVFALLTMINFDYKKELSRIYMVGSALSVVLMIMLIPTFRAVGTAWTAVLTEGFVTFLMFAFLWKKDIRVWKWRRK